MLSPIDTVTDWRKLITFPDIAWTAPYSRGQFNGKDSGPHFLSNLTLVDIWDGSADDHDVLAKKAWKFYSDVRGPEDEWDLKWWLARFDDMQYLPYNISPKEKVDKLQRDEIEIMVGVYKACAVEIDVFDPIWTGSDEMLHEVKLITSVQFEMRQKLDSAISSLDQFQLLVADARIEAFLPVLSAILAEMKVLRCSSYAAPVKRSLIDQATERINIQLMNLKGLGLWDGKWQDLNEGEHMVLESDEDLKYFWCKCGRNISLQVEEVVDWKERQGTGVDQRHAFLKCCSARSPQRNLKHCLMLGTVPPLLSDLT